MSIFFSVTEYVRLLLAQIDTSISEDSINAVIDGIIQTLSLDWTPAFVLEAHYFLEQFTAEFEKNELGDNIPIGHWLDSSRGDKLSFHYISKALVLDNNYISGKALIFYYVNKLSNALTDEMREMLKTEVSNVKKSVGVWSFYIDSFMAARIKMTIPHKKLDTNGWVVSNNTVVDESVYTRNRQFRLVLNTKIGSRYHFRQMKKKSTRRQISFW